MERGTGDPEARELLERGEYGVLSTCGADGPYGIPLSYCVMNDALYFHCAVEGRKLDNLAHDDRVSFCVVGATEVLAEQFATCYESVIISGRAVQVGAEEKQQALEGLLAKYSPAHIAAGLDYIASAWAKTKVFRVDVDAICGKARR